MSLTPIQEEAATEWVRTCLEYPQYGELKTFRNSFATSFMELFESGLYPNFNAFNFDDIRFNLL
jgi:hypothetical protein